MGRLLCTLIAACLGGGLLALTLLQDPKPGYTDTPVLPGIDFRVLPPMLGSKSDKMLRSKGVAVDGVYEDHVEKLDFIRVRNIARDLVKQFLDGDADELQVIYTAFLSAGKQRTASVRLLPIERELPPEDFAAFTETYRARLRQAYPMADDSITLFPFRRMFMVVTRAQ